MRAVIAVYVENKFGVLARVSGMIMRRGFNIDSLTVGETDDPQYSRITITLNGDEYARRQLILQLQKLFNVRQVKLLDA
ncbi:MAG: acetolactate synthase small subunit, partial [Clostridia bacterium]|nr:acetolactate synthase small subunit [Clostridia bacterium]